ncbi:ribonuclease H-like domain, reverse transcriptase, RNA-dependent DNA polymerase [Tanacetum coccineum]
MEEINNFQQDLDKTIYQALEQFKELLLRCPQHYLTDMQVVISFYNGLDMPTRQILDSKGAIPSMKAVDAKKVIQDMLNNLGRGIKKVNEKVYAAQVGCESCKGPHYTKDCPLKEEGKTLEEAYYTQFGVPFQQGGQYRAAALGFYQRNNRNPSYQERRQTMEESLSKFMAECPQNSKLFFKPRQATISFPSCLYDECYDEEEGSYGLKDLDAYSIGTTLLDDTLPQKEKDPRSFILPCYINHLCFNKALADLEASVSVMPFSTYTNLWLGELAPTKLIIELADRIVKRPKRIAENVLVRIDKFVFLVDFIVLDMPEDIRPL